VSLHDFLRGLAEFFQHSSPHSPRVSTYFQTNPWGERADVKEETLDESDEETTTSIGPKDKQIHSDETAQDTEEERKSTKHGHHGVPFLVQMDYNRGPAPAPGQMEQHVRETGGSVAAAVVPHYSSH